MTTSAASRPGLRAVTVATTTLLALVLGLWLRPTAHSLPEDEHGDPQLAASIRQLTGSRPSAVAVGLVYADAIERGEVEPGTTLGEVFGLGEVPAAGVTLGAGRSTLRCSEGSTP